MSLIDVHGKVIILMVLMMCCHVN